MDPDPVARWEPSTALEHDEGGHIRQLRSGVLHRA